ILAVSALLFSLLLMAVYSLMAFERDTPTETLLSGDEKVNQFFHNAGFYGLFLTSLLPLPLCLAISPAVSLRVRFALGLLFAIMLVALVFTYIRGAWLGSAVSLVVLLLMSSEVRRLFLRMSPLLLVAFLVSGGVVMQILWARTYSVDAFFQSGSWTERVDTWQTGWQMAIHNPATGVGPGMFRYTYLDYKVGDDPFFWTNSHNLLLTVWAETGFLAVAGLTGFFAISLWMGQRLFRSAKDPLVKAVSLGLFAGLIGYLVGASLHGAILTHYTLDEEAFSGGHTLYLFLVPALIIVMNRMQDRAGQG
ncbi:MAG: exopolysaccharide biosynthesis protein ExoQ, partial [Dehalococcoidia bacterium]|nr:exopolysaccharide biosynthesis protein ExoQ [Dehalococcoidia bacterium]